MFEDPDVRAKAYLVSNKIPWELATALTFDEKVSFAKAIARILDSNFEWSTMRLPAYAAKTFLKAGRHGRPHSETSHAAERHRARQAGG